MLSGSGSSILTKYEPVASHGDPVRAKFREVPLKGNIGQLLELWNFLYFVNVLTFVDIFAICYCILG